MSESAQCVVDEVQRSVQHVVVIVDAAGKISCLPPVLDVSGGDVLISFALKGSDWVFPDTAAVVVSRGAGQFPFPAWTVNNKQVVLFDRNTVPGNFSYTVTVENAVTGRRQSLDPTIKNET
jgi:hypothetical protein